MPPVVWHLTITRSDIEDIIVIELAGRLSAATAPELRRVLASIAGEDRRGVLLDLSHLDYMNSAGVRVLREAAARLNGVGASLAVAGLCEAVRLAFTLAGPVPNLAILESREAALRAVKNAAWRE